MNISRRRGFSVWRISLGIAFAPAVAEAHNTLPGMGEFANGFAHPIATPSHLMVLIGLGLLLGQRPPLRLKIPLTLFACASALSLLATTAGFMKVEPPVVLAAISLVAGLLVAGEVRLPAWAIRTLFVLAAITMGLDSVADTAVTPWAVTKTLFGTWISFTVWIVDIAYYVSLLPPRKWLQIGIRVAGSWLVAISFLIVAFALKR